MDDSRRKSDSTAIPYRLPKDPSRSFDPGKTMIQDLLFGQPPPDETVDLKGAINVGDLFAELSLPEELEAVFGQAPDGDSATAPDGPSYELIRPVAEGGFGEVWEALQTSLGRRIAVKRLRPSLEKDFKASAYITRHLTSTFRQEALTTGALEHPNIVPVYDLGTDEEGRPLMAMKMVRGRPWDEVLRDEFTNGTSVRSYLARHIPILISVAQAVAFAHSRGVVHRDIKPSQVMLGEFGEVLLTDWGLALVFDTSKAELQGPQLALSEFTPWSPRVTSPAGTPSYMAPEQTEETAVDVGPETDVYLLGGCLYFILTGKAPHEEETAELSFERAVEGHVFEPEQVAPQGRRVPRELSMLAIKALAPDRKDRPSSREFIDALAAYMVGSDKRQEAEELLEQAELIARHSWAYYEDYSELGELTSLLDRVLAFDPDNMRAHQLRQQALIHFARIAITNNDLKLALFQANRMDPGRERDRILAEIEALQRKQSQAQRGLEQLYRRTTHERDNAERDRAHCEQVLAQVLSDLLASLHPLGLTPLLKDSAAITMKYFDATPERKPTRNNIYNRIQALRAAGDVFSSSGVSDKAMEAYRRAESLIRDLLAVEPTSTTLSGELDQVRERIYSLERFTDNGPSHEVVSEFEHMRQNILMHLDQLLERHEPK